VKGDALIQNDVERAWGNAVANGATGSVDLLLFSVGFTGVPKFNIRKGFVIDPPNLVTRSVLNTLSTMPHPYTAKIVVISAMGSTNSSHSTLPFLLRLFHGYFLYPPLRDKAGTERVLAHCAGTPWDSESDGQEPTLEIMGSGDWKQIKGLPEPGSLKGKVLVVRPTLLTDGECLADKKVVGDTKPVYKVSDGKVSSAWSVSRKDVAYFVVDAVLNQWEHYGGRSVNIAY